MINRIDIVSIPVSDQTRAKDFYIDILGFELKVESPMGPERTWVQLCLPSAETSITLVTWFDSMPPGSVQGLVLNTDNIEAEHQALIAKGLKIGDIDSTPWGKFASFNDPDNNGWVLQEAVS